MWALHINARCLYKTHISFGGSYRPMAVSANLSPRDSLAVLALLLATDSRPKSLLACRAPLDGVLNLFGDPREIGLIWSHSRAQRLPPPRESRRFFSVLRSSARFSLVDSSAVRFPAEALQTSLDLFRRLSKLPLSAVAHFFHSLFLSLSRERSISLFLEFSV